jgi:predicted dehydrogenase
MDVSRKNFFIGSAATIAAMGLKAADKTPAPKIQGFNESIEMKLEGEWQPYSDKKVRVGIAGNGVCGFGAQFMFEMHPNVEVVACTDLFPDRCKRLQERVRAKRTYPSCEEMIDKEKEMDAVFIATDAPSHIDLALRALDRGFHVASAVPALFGDGQLDRVPKLVEAVKKSGLVYAMFETTAFRPQCFAMRNIYEAGGFGELIYTEGEYFHYFGEKGIGSYKGWRDALPPQWYPTHSNGFYTCTTHKGFTEVTCLGKPSILSPYKGAKNRYGNPFGSEFAIFRTAEGGTARMLVAWDLPNVGGEIGRCYGQKGQFSRDRYAGDNSLVKNVKMYRTFLPPGVKNNGHHGGSHPYLTDDFVRAILTKGKPCVDVKTALDTTVGGIYAHMSAMKGGETLKIPAFVS